MTNEQNAAVYEDYQAALETYRALPAAKQAAAKIPQWSDSVKKLGLDPETLKAKAGKDAADAAAKVVSQKAARAKADADLARAQQEEVAAKTTTPAPGASVKS